MKAAGPEAEAEANCCCCLCKACICWELKGEKSICLRKIRRDERYRWKVSLRRVVIRVSRIWGACVRRG